MTSILAHDLRNPLTVARGRLELARETGNPDDFVTVTESLDRIETLVEDVLRLTSETESIDEFSPTNLEAAARSAWQSVQTGHVTLDVEDSMEFEAAESSLRQVFENLYRNTVEHGGESVTTVGVGTLDTDGFYVEDDGVGIPPSERETVFEWGATSDTDGTGLGLAIVSESIAAHGWTVTVTDSSAGGARFEVKGIDSV